MFEVKRVEDRDEKNGRLKDIHVTIGPSQAPGIRSSIAKLSQTEALDLAVEITKAALSSVSAFETAWKRAEAKETDRQRAASVPPKP